MTGSANGTTASQTAMGWRTRAAKHPRVPTHPSERDFQLSSCWRTGMNRPSSEAPFQLNPSRPFRPLPPPPLANRHRQPVARYRHTPESAEILRCQYDFECAGNATPSGCHEGYEGASVGCDGIHITPSSDRTIPSPICPSLYHLLWDPSVRGAKRSRHTTEIQ